MFFIATLSVYCFTYIALTWLIARLFSSREIFSLRSVGIILSISIASLFITLLIPDAFWQNRFQHAVAGGVVATVISFYALRDSGKKLSWIHTAVLMFLITMSLGIANELLEFFVQYKGWFIFNDSINDTWWDLLSNTFGSVAALSIYASFHIFKHRSKAQSLK